MAVPDKTVTFETEWGTSVSRKSKEIMGTHINKGNREFRDPLLSFGQVDGSQDAVCIVR